MDIPSKHVYDVLEAKNVEHLHHANSVATACLFLRKGSLLSRGTVERYGLPQTPQESDDIDKRYGIWFDLFLDSVDIHKRASRANAYGPVLFVFSNRLIDKNRTGRIWVTKENPINWSGLDDDERWFENKIDLEGNFVKGEFNQMIVLRHCGGAIPFGGYLESILLDDPQATAKGRVDLYSMALGALRLAMQQGGIGVPIRRRKCAEACACVGNWHKDQTRLFTMFDPMFDD